MSENILTRLLMNAVLNSFGSSCLTLQKRQVVKYTKDFRDFGVSVPVLKVI